MALFLIFFCSAAWLGSFTALVLGYFVPSGMASITTHVLFGLLSPLAGILGLCITMFYFIATGSAIRGVAERGLITVEDYKRTVKFKMVLFPILMVGMVALMAAPILGAAADAKSLPLWVHHAVAWVALLVFGFVIVKMTAFLNENVTILLKAGQGVAAEKALRKAEAES